MKRFAKVLVHGLAVVLVLPAWLGYRFNSLLFGRKRAFAGWSQALSLVPGLWGIYLRRAFYRLVLAGCGENACLNFGTVLTDPGTTIGRYAYVGSYCVLGEVSLEDDVLLGSQVSVVNGGAQHGIERLDIPVREQPGKWPRITIGRDSWVGDRAVVLADIGKHCVIGAGSVVTKPIPDYAIAVGVPARVVRYRNRGEPGVLAPGENARQFVHSSGD